MPNAPAARVTDQVKHSEAQDYRFWGAVGGALLGLAIIGGAAALEVVSFGAATPLVVIVGTVMIAGGGVAGLSSAGANVAANMGRHVPGPVEGPIVTGIPSILIGTGPDKHAAAHLGSYVSCNRHKHGGATAMEQAKDVAEDVGVGLLKDVASVATFGLYGGGKFSPGQDVSQGIADAEKEHGDLEQIVQGSVSVLLGRGRFHAARIGDQGTCGFTVGQGCETVIIGGESVTDGTIGDGDDPYKGVTDAIGEWGGYVALAGVFLVTLPVSVPAAFLETYIGYNEGQLQGEIVNALFSDQESRDKANLALAMLPVFHGMSRMRRGGGHGGAEEAGGVHGGAEGESGTGPKDGGATHPGGGDPTAAGDAHDAAPPPPAPAGDAPRASGDAAHAPSDAPHAPSDAPPADNPVHQFDKNNGGSPTLETPNRGAAGAADEGAGREPSQAGKDKAFQERAAARTRAVREGSSNRVRKGGSNVAASEFTPEPGSQMADGAGKYEPSVSGETAPTYGERVSKSTGERANPTEPGTGDLAGTTRPLKEPGQHEGPRANDSEIKQMEALKRDLDANPNMRGTLDIYSDPNEPCTSCKEASEKFNDAYKGRARVRIHTPDGKVFEKGGAPLDAPPGGPRGARDPLVQQGPHDGGMSGDGPGADIDTGGTGEGGARAADAPPENSFPGRQSGNNCAPQSARQIIAEATGTHLSEAEMGDLAQKTGAYDPETGTRAGGEADILNAAGVPAEAQPGTPRNIQNALRQGKGVITGHRAADLWPGDPNFPEAQAVPAGMGHAVHTTGLVRDAQGNVTHYRINDTASGTEGRLVPADQYENSLDGGPATVTKAHIRPASNFRPGDDVPAEPTTGGAPGRWRSAAPEEAPRAPGDEPPADRAPADRAPSDAPPRDRAAEDEAARASSPDPLVQQGDVPGGKMGGEEEGGAASSGTESDTPSRAARARRPPITYAGGPAVIPKTNPNGGHLPADFGLRTIAEVPEQHRLFQQALKNMAESPRTNAYKTYLEVRGRGELPTYDQANKAWGVVRQEYTELSTDAGINMAGVQVHHWNFNKGDFPLQVTDPRNLVHTTDRQINWNSHQAIHQATSNTTDFWKAQTGAAHQIPIDTGVSPLAPPAPPSTSP